MQSDIEQCEVLLRGGSYTFHAASRTLPRRYREPAMALYAFCRLADDAIDGGGHPEAAVISLNRRLDKIYQGAAMAHPVDRAFAAAISQHAIPRALPQALLEGFQWDAEGRRYETLDDLVGYAVRVAGTVGGMMTLLMGERSQPVLARAIELGVAMQLTNIARDVGEDARQGRLYLPLRWLHETGIDPDRFIATPVFDARIAAIVRRLLCDAQALYSRAERGIAFLPPRCRPAISAASILYAEIGRQVSRNAFDSVSRRAVVPLSRKLTRLGAIGAVTFAGRQALADAPLYQAHFLLDAIPAPAPETAETQTVVDRRPRRRLTDRAVWVIDLFERLERRQQLQQAGT